jgi:hypothetical protein
MTLQHVVPGAGGRNSGDPAPGRSPGPPMMFDTSTNFQRLTVSPDSTRDISRYRPEISMATRDPKLNDSLPEKSEVTRSYGRHLSSTVGETSSSHYREDVTQEYGKPTLGEDEYSSPFSRFNGDDRITDSGEYVSSSDDGYTIPVLRETKDLRETPDADDYTKDTWRQGSILDDADYNQDRTVSEENPTIILTSDSDQSISLQSYPGFLSYEEEEGDNKTDSWCGGVLSADVKVVTNLWSGLINVTVMHPLFRTDVGLVRVVTYQGKHKLGCHRNQSILL